jgi:hypothetical protein
MEDALQADATIKALNCAGLTLNKVTLSLQVQGEVKGEVEVDLYVVAGGSIDKTQTAIVTLILAKPTKLGAAGEPEAAAQNLALFYRKMFTDDPDLKAKVPTVHRMGQAPQANQNKPQNPFVEAIVAAAKASVVAYCSSQLPLPQNEVDAEVDYEVSKSGHLGLDVKIWGAGVTGTATVTNETLQKATFAFTPSKPPCKKALAGLPCD